MSSDEQYDYYNNIMKHVIQKPILQHSTIKSRIIKEISSINYDQENIKINIEIQPIDDYKKLKILIYLIFNTYKSDKKYLFFDRFFDRFLEHYFGKNPYAQLCRLFNIECKLKRNLFSLKFYYIKSPNLQNYLGSRKFLNSDAFYSSEMNKNIYNFPGFINLIEAKHSVFHCNSYIYWFSLDHKTKYMINLMVFLEQANIKYKIEYTI
jgi:hypothetical protein